MKKILLSVIAGLLLFMHTSCATSQTTLQSADIMKLRSGMNTEEVVAILHTNPSSRSFYFNDGTYLLRWDDSREKEAGGDIRHLTILFKQDNRMVSIVEENFVAEDH